MRRKMGSLSQSLIGKDGGDFPNEKALNLKYLRETLNLNQLNTTRGPGGPAAGQRKLRTTQGRRRTEPREEEAGANHGADLQGSRR